MEKLIGGNEPSDVAAERQVIGAMLKSPDALAIGLEKLEKDDFYSPANQAIFEGLSSLFVDNIPCDVTTIFDRLVSNKTIETTGGRLHLMALVEQSNTTRNISYHSAIVKDKARRRNLSRLGIELRRDAQNEYKKVEETIAQVETRLLACAGIVGGEIGRAHV